jgi:release factor glutamine methyltransferase
LLRPISATQALAVARHNGAVLEAGNISFHFGDWFAALNENGLPCSSRTRPTSPTMSGAKPTPASAFEPRLALSGGPDGLAEIRRIVSAAPAHLESGGWLLLEHGFRQAAAVQACSGRQGSHRSAPIPIWPGSPESPKASCLPEP